MDSDGPGWRCPLQSVNSYKSLLANFPGRRSEIGPSADRPIDEFERGVGLKEGSIKYAGRRFPALIPKRSSVDRWNCPQFPRNQPTMGRRPIRTPVTGLLADTLTRGLDISRTIVNSRTGQVADLTTRGLACCQKNEN